MEIEGQLRKVWPMMINELRKVKNIFKEKNSSHPSEEFVDEKLGSQVSFGRF